METPTGNFTINEAAEAWIKMIESPEAKGTPEQRADLIAKVRAAALKTIGITYGVGSVKLTPTTQMCFADATNAIKQVIRGGK